METEPTIEELELANGPSGPLLDSDDVEALAEERRQEKGEEG